MTLGIDEIWSIYGPIHPERYHQNFEEDLPLTTWVVECCQLGKHMTPLIRLHNNYKVWCVTHGEQILGKTTFGRQLEVLGFHKHATTTGVSFVGLYCDEDSKRIERLKAGREGIVVESIETFLAGFCLEITDSVYGEYLNQMRYLLGDYQVGKEEFLKRLSGRLFTLELQPVNGEEF